MLTKAMLSGLTADQMALHPAGWYEAQNIVQILERQVVAVDTQNKQLEPELPQAARPRVMTPASSNARNFFIFIPPKK